MEKVWIAVVCVILLLAVILRKKAEWLLNGCIRAVMGVIAICFINYCLDQQGIYPGIGVNAITVLTSAILGFPGVAALYGIGFYKFL